jgi:hypothetical protein
MLQTTASGSTGASSYEILNKQDLKLMSQRNKNSNKKTEINEKQE